MQHNEIIDLSQRKSFSFDDFYAASQNSGHSLGEAAMRKKLQELQKSGEVVRVGRNAYCMPSNPVRYYQYSYSELARNVAAIMMESYPAVGFTVFEIVQLNEFVNHQLAHDVLFLSVEEELMDFVFGTMKERFPGKVMLDPTPELYHQYWYENMIVIDKLVTEAPKSREVPWHTRLEKLLVDLLSNPILTGSISESEVPAVFEDAFTKYVIDESSLLRYAKRRGADKRLRTMIREKTDITLRTE